MLKLRRGKWQALGSAVSMTFIISVAFANVALIFIDQSSVVTGNNAQLPKSIRLTEVDGIGLVIKAQVNGAGSFKFVVDTGSGINLISPKVARAANISFKPSPRQSTSQSVNQDETLVIGGLSDGLQRIGQTALIKELALGDQNGKFRFTDIKTIVIDGLPIDIDGVVDPITVFGSLGITIDFPNHLLEVFDPSRTPLRIDKQPFGGTVVNWLADEDERLKRPFIMLNDGRKALIDSGSGLGLAMSIEDAHDMNLSRTESKNETLIKDITGGTIRTRRVAPTTVVIGSMELHNIPTDIIEGAHSGSPLLLGRAALQPFRVTFDPRSRLISFAPIKR